MFEWNKGSHAIFTDHLGKRNTYLHSVFTLRPIILRAGSKIAHCPAYNCSCAKAGRGRSRRSGDFLRGLTTMRSIALVEYFAAIARAAGPATADSGVSEAEAEPVQWRSGGDFFQTRMRVTNRSLSIGVSGCHRGKIE